MMYNEGITIGGKHSFDDFGLVIADREIGTPPKNSIRKTVPFMNGFYDFTNLNGSPSWGARSIKYSFDVIGATVEEMEAERLPVVNWLCNVHDADIFDDAIPEYHFHGSFDSLSVSEDGEKVTLTFTFICYPFMIKNTPRVVVAASSGSYTLQNDGQPVRLIVTTEAAATVAVGDRQQSIAAGVSDGKTGLIVASGENAVTVTSNGKVTLQITEEVL